MLTKRFIRPMSPSLFGLSGTPTQGASPSPNKTLGSTSIPNAYSPINNTFESPARRFWLDLTYGTSGHFLRAEQITPIDSLISDHKGFIVQLGAGHKIISLNWMKQCAEHNNGFRQKESDKQYLDRLDAIAKILSPYLEQGYICIGAESMIKKEDVSFFNERLALYRDNNNSTLHVTQFGVSVIFPNVIMQNAFSQNEKLASELGDLTIRSQLFDASDAYSFASVHVPFTNTDMAYKEIEKKLLNSKIENDFDGHKCLDWIGDKNESPEKQASLTKEVIDALFEERKVQGKKPLTIISYLVTNPDGHLQNHGGEECHVNVDSCHRFVIYESEEYAYHHIPESDEGGKYQRLLGVLLGGSLVTANIDLDELALIEVALLTHEHFHM
ncbi:MAG: hypothetical protein NTZ67_03340 [Gammaproteobacteria bacterium]|nr:hypothetical protein [Gammaproteobacteria bacterium]